VTGYIDTHYTVVECVSDYPGSCLEVHAFWGMGHKFERESCAI